MKNLEKFLEFDGKRISVLLADGTWWVAVKPICTALGIDYRRQHRTIQEDKILGQLWSVQTIVAADKKRREMVCLPEKYVYGWLFSIRSDSGDLLEYKKICYDVLYNHFHGAITGRISALTERAQAEQQILALEEEWERRKSESPEYKEIQALKKRRKDIDRTLRQMDENLINGQMSFDFPQN